MIGSEDSPTTYEYNWHYKILPQLNNWSKEKKRFKNGTKVKEGFIYSSDKNSEWMKQDELLSLINKIK
jgi:hypothetical protein